MLVGVLVVPFSVYTEISLMVTSTPPAWYQASVAPMDMAHHSDASSISSSSGTTGGGGGGGGSNASLPWQPCMLIGPVFAGCTFVSISTIFLMTLERSVAILRPLHKDVLVTRRRALLLILLSWAGSFLLAVAPLVLSRSFTLEYNPCSRMCNYAPLWDPVQQPRPPPDAHVMLLFPAFDFSLLGGTLAVNIVSFTSIRRYSRKRKLLAEGSLGGESSGGGGGGWCQHRPSFSDIKAAKTIGILTFAFTASFSPIAVFVLGNVVGYTWCNFSFFAFWILAANSCCNVVIYSVRDQRFRKGVTLLFHRERSIPTGEKT